MNDALLAALGNLSGEVPLLSGMMKLLNALGYRSHRTAEAGSVDEFLERFMTHVRITEKQLCLFEPWLAVEIVFQLTSREIGAQSSMLDPPPVFENGRIESFLFLAVDMAEDTYTRNHLAETTRTINRRFAMPVILLFRYGSTLTIAATHRRTNKQDDSRDVLERVTLVKDIRVNNPHRAHLEILASLALPRMLKSGISSFDGLYASWEKTLDIEALNKRFYSDLFSWFERASNECIFPDDGAGKGYNERHVIRLITRLLFIWFLKEKDNLIPDQLFSEKFAHEALKRYGSDSTCYYRAVLQNLFFATMNTEIDKREFGSGHPNEHNNFNKYCYRDLLSDPDAFIEMLKRVPYVNGGLFNCLDSLGTSGVGRYIDAFATNPAEYHKLQVPARLFLDPKDGLFALFRSYKFTIEENTPLDQEVALDPELLGRVFENLLASYNPETRETARKKTGSYYTPRLVVDYMVREALTEALVANSTPSDGDVAFWRDRLQYLLDHSDTMDDADELFEEDDRRAIVAAIAKIRTLDPAVGSGAFPMGILQTLTLALRRLDPDNDLWEELQKERAKERAGAAFDTRDQWTRDDALREISTTFEKYRHSDFGRKLYLIQNGIYGVDIQPIACQITKLRFFISLVIEQDPIPGAPNLGIRPLPNLETRFVSADTLIGLNRSVQMELGRTDAVQKLEQELIAIRERHFHADDRSKKLELQKQDVRLRDQMATLLKQVGLPTLVADSIVQWDPYNQNTSSGWFDPEYMFCIADGFDVVIGNPPYVESRNSLLSLEKKQIYINQVVADWDSTVRRGSDLLIYFLARSAKLLHSKGKGCLITHNAWLNTDYGLAFQNFSKGRFSFDRIVDTSAKFFSDRYGPNINAIISLFSKTNVSSIEYIIVNENMKLSGQRRVGISRNIKWGHLFSMPEFFESILNAISKEHDTSKVHEIRFGQGINIPKSRLNVVGADVRVIVKDVQFVAETVNDVLSRNDVSKSRLNNPPALILPRGIGDRHYCTYNLHRAQSFSTVELYLEESLWDSDLHYCLWAYLNSSFVWLFREITGRKNLGGGLLKAEATDMKGLPIAFSFDFGHLAREVFQTLRIRKPLPISQEILSDEHTKIDEMIGDYFNFSDEMGRVRNSLLERVNARMSRSRNRR